VKEKGAGLIKSRMSDALTLAIRYRYETLVVRLSNDNNNHINTNGLVHMLASGWRYTQHVLRGALEKQLL
jgi:hypothetical protein